MKRILCGLILTCALSLPATAQVVISQVYGGGGNSGATLKNDFIELFNPGMAAVSVTGWSVQYASSTGASWQKTSLSGSIQPGGYYLVQQAQGAGGTVNLPAPDATGTISMSGTAGKVALVSNATTLTESCPAGLVDFAGFGSANCFEGAGPTGALSNTTAALRNGAGCTDTNNNSADFTVGTPAPRNSASPVNLCPAGVTITTASPLPQGFLVNPYGATIQALGGMPPYSYSWSGGTPSGLTLSAAGAISGTPASTGIFNFTVTATDANSLQGSKAFTMTVAAPSCTPTHIISQIQGSGAKTPIPANTAVTTRGLVTGISGNGFFIQDPVGDGDAQTSDGIFVFTGNNNVPANAAVGNDVCVSGAVTEFPAAAPASLTELTRSGPIPITVVALSNGNAPPAHATISGADTNPGVLNNLERFEGMRVQVPMMTVVAPTNGIEDEANATSASGGTFFGVVSGVARPFREPGALVFDPSLPEAPCCVPEFDSNPERIRVPTFVLQASTPINVAAGATITNLTGVLDYNSQTYSLLPDNAVTPSINDTVAATPVSTPASGEATVASFNLERFYDTVNDPGVSDVVLTPAAFERRLRKASLAIRNVLKTPDILAVVEMENLTTLQTLASRMDADAQAAGQTAPNYTAYLAEGNDVGGIDVGFLVKNDGRVNVLEVAQEGKDSTFIDPVDGSVDILNDRPPLVLRATITQAGSVTALPLTVIANHLRSLNDVEANNATGKRVRAKRNAQAEYLATLAQNIQTANPSEKVVLAGDFNAFEFSDGLVDVIGAIKGTPAPANQVVAASKTITNPPLTDLVESVAAQNRYSFSFDGSAQVLDHIMVNNAAASSVARLEFARNNADFPDVLRNDAARPERISDHDAPVAYFRLPLTTDIGGLVQFLTLGNLNNPRMTQPQGDVRVVNQSGEFINGPVYLFIENLPAEIIVLNADGYWQGTPYFLISNDGLAPGASKPVRLKVSKPAGMVLTFTPRVMSGTL